jgi:hypothetical protein
MHNKQFILDLLLMWYWEKNAWGWFW